MLKHLTGAALAALTITFLAAPAAADIVILRDGTVLPSKVADDVLADEYPSEAALAKSGRGNLDLRFDKVKIGRTTVDASEVADVYGTNASRNSNFGNALNNARSGYWGEALPAFRAAADELKDADKQIALWNAVLCAQRLSGAEAVDAAKRGVDELLKAFPDGYYMPKAQILLCRVLLSKGQAKSAADALDAVLSTSNMNARDYFEAAVSRIDFFQYPRSRTPDQYAKVEAAYRKILGDIKSKRAEKSAAVPMLRATVGVGKSLVGQRKPDEAAKFFAQVVDNNHALSDKSVLADAHRGMGDVIYLQLSKKIAGGTTPEDKDAVLDQLERATLQYLRVILQYREEAADALQPAMQSVAQVWQWQFEIEGGENLELATRAVRMYINAYKKMPGGPAKQELFRHAKAFIAKRDALRERLAAPVEDDE